MFTSTEPVLDDRTGTMEADWAGLRGDTWFFTISKDPLTGWGNRVWTAQIRANAADDDPEASFTVINSSDSSHVDVFFRLDTDDLLGSWVYDVQWHDPDTDVTETIVRGKVKIKQDVTRD